MCDLLRRLKEFGYDVRVVPTASALKFVGRPTWEALSGQSASSDIWEEVQDVPHVAIGQKADLVIIAPATADLMSKAATGRADDLLTSVLLTTRAPVIFAPAMHTEMWEHPATVANVETLRSRGAIVIEPSVGRLTGPDSGTGRLAEPASLASVCRAALEGGSGSADLAGRRVLVTAGGTREPLDPVRFLGNRSSGRQGWALAAAAAARGASVKLIAANVDLPEPAGSQVIRVETTSQMFDAVLAEAGEYDAVVMAAAVADFRSTSVANRKIKKDDSGNVPEPIELVRNPDILAALGEKWSQSPTPVVVGFAAETISDEQDREAVGEAKRAAKGANVIVVNEVGVELGFESALNSASILDGSGVVIHVPQTSKEELANAVWDAVIARLPRAERGTEFPAG